MAPGARGGAHQERSAPPKDGYSSGGYAWCLAHWGTKWPADHVEVEGPVTVYDEKTLQIVFHFDTAWRPPTPVIAKAAKLYPALSLDPRYFEFWLRTRAAGIWGAEADELRPSKSREVRSLPTAAHASRQPLIGLSSRVKGGGRARLVFFEEKKCKRSAPEAAVLFAFFPERRGVQGGVKPPAAAGKKREGGRRAKPWRL